MRGVRVETSARFYEEATGRVQVDEIRPEWFVFSSGFENGRYKRLVKRCFDVFAASLLLIIALPWMLLAVVIITIEGKGPILFRQDRVGLYGKTFRILKFRTMVPAPPDATPQWAASNDKRITAVGRLMRTFRIDELPQLLNVLRGDMSLVGPRPEQPYFCQLLADNIPFYHQRHTIPPGLTGWAQVRYRYGATIAESKRKLEFDLFYVKHLSIWLDLAILFETVKVVLVGRGAK
jgi:exopolysaccharide biosynthesis polyprenyl glycosylphosphotransferase